MSSAISSMADVVKSILGRHHLQPIDLIDLPIVDERFCFWGVYLDVVLKNDTDLVEGVYLGSSLGYKGVACKDDITPHFQTVSLFKVTRGNAVASILAKQGLIIYLSTAA
ncbi:hypothetical protein LB504_011297 [Fusarium proliferatum]|nr:hypothetical protein LB504_011297 [Fusarium proliferatum]